jgi:hypothetical protein
MSVEDVGSIQITDCNDANIPVSCFLIEPNENEDEDYQGKWKWTADNYMPRKGISVDQYQLFADTKEEILELINKHVVPLYQIALNEIKTGTLYYWESPKTNNKT